MEAGMLPVSLLPYKALPHSNAHTLVSWHTHGMWYSYQGAANEVWMQHASMCTGHETGTAWSGDSMEEHVNMCAVVALTN